MTEEEQVEEQEDARVYVGFHQLGGIRLVADDVRLTPAEAFILAGQLTAHATMGIQMGYAEDAARNQALLGNNSGLIVPPGVK